ncbi:MAG: hypothetical protein HN617_14635 [Planctomycetaceae bacterium]|nr:hypothetical protein [Planctomycetaceae bacterium]MBT4726206.1 hypothetical protein [Planctomycetaceae bacterium]MBT5123082.1 hypothetical protein [Planctomycetaceae bacterium]MBT6848981.1 hypothetical protein [Planctomycetaceae bacterium]MBT7257307.1 hypothetical protein [Planctomycetaceae bacterium]
MPVTDQQTPSPNLSRWFVICSVFAAVMAIAGFMLHLQFFHDDAYITLRYAQHWLRGDGIVFNATERVEGYTSFFHLALISGTAKLIGGEDFLPLIAQGIGIVAFGGICAIIAFVFKPATNQSNYSSRALLLLLVPTNLALIAWSLGGLETTLYTALLMLLTYQFSNTPDSSRFTAKKIFCLGILLAIITMTRPEAILFVGITGLFLLTPHGFKSPRWKSLSILTLSFLAIWLPYFLWRWNYYGDPFPNTYYVKMDTDLMTRLRNGFHYLHTYSRIAPFILPLGIMTGLLALIQIRTKKQARHHRNQSLFYMLSIAGVGTLYVCYTGGDHMPAYRFFVPLIPIYGWLLAQSLPIIIPSLVNRHTRILYVCCMGLICMQTVCSNQKMRTAQRIDPAASVGRDVGIWIQQNLPADSTIALNTAGSTPFFAPQHRFIDMLGLNDRHIAHRQIKERRTWMQQFPGHGKGDGQYVLKRKPDYIILGPAQGLPSNPEFVDSQDVIWFLSDLELTENDEFHKNYQLRKETFRGASGVLRMLMYYQRKEANNAAQDN